MGKTKKSVVSYFVWPQENTLVTDSLYESSFASYRWGGLCAYLEVPLVTRFLQHLIPKGMQGFDCRH